MNDIVDRDPAAMEKFSGQLSDFCDTMAQKAALLVKLCGEAEHAMQDQSGVLVTQRLTAMAEDIQTQVARGRALADRISRSAAILAESEKEE